MTINSRIGLLVVGPTLFWLTPGIFLALTTHAWLFLLLPFLGFYPGLLGSPGCSETLMTTWGCFSLLGFASLVLYAHRKSSPSIAVAFAILITLSSLTFFVRFFCALQNGPSP
jgi:hypothetical protein